MTRRRPVLSGFNWKSSSFAVFCFLLGIRRFSGLPGFPGLPEASLARAACRGERLFGGRCS